SATDVPRAERERLAARSHRVLVVALGVRERATHGEQRDAQGCTLGWRDRRRAFDGLLGMAEQALRLRVALLLDADHARDADPRELLLFGVVDRLCRPQ